MAKLGSYLAVVLCKSEYEQVMPKPTTGFLLYLDGRKSTPAALPAPAVFDDFRNDSEKEAARGACFNVNKAALDDERSANEAKAAADAASQALSKNPADNSLQATAKSKAAAAQIARQKADDSRVAARATYVLAYYLDPGLVTNNETKDSWLQLLQSPWRQGDVAVSVGPAAGAWPSQAGIKFERLNYGWLAGWAALFVAAVAIFLKYGLDSIRDTGTLAPAFAGAKNTFSLGRTQMALWTFLVAGALMFIFMVTWNQNTITSGVLVLLGISAGTTLLAAVAEGPPAPQPTKGFFSDLLTDGTGPAVQRLQMLLFTVILAVIFVVKVINGLVMPEFDPTLLALMGISNGTYLGFKLQGR
jgi:hypothetical protein